MECNTCIMCLFPISQAGAIYCFQCKKPCCVDCKPQTHQMTHHSAPSSNKFFCCTKCETDNEKGINISED